MKAVVFGGWESHFWRVTIERIQSFLVQNSFENILFTYYFMTLDQMEILFGNK
jgi:hypothetical protein